MDVIVCDFQLAAEKEELQQQMSEPLADKSDSVSATRIYVRVTILCYVFVARSDIPLLRFRLFSPAERAFSARFSATSCIGGNRIGCLHVDKLLLIQRMNRPDFTEHLKYY